MIRLFYTTVLAFLLSSSLVYGQYYRSNSHAYSHSTSQVEIERLKGDSWAGPHPGCMMCMGNHLISTHGQSYAQLNMFGWAQWSILHDNLHNSNTKEQPNKKSDPNLIFVPTPQDVVDKMLQITKIQKDDIVYDLGCGDGRIVITANKVYGVKAVGYEINKELVILAKKNADRQNVLNGFLDNHIYIKQQDILTVDLSKASVITLYLFPELNAKLVPQIKNMRVGSRIVSHYHKIPGLVVDKQVVVKSTLGSEHTIYLYKIKSFL